VQKRRSGDERAVAGLACAGRVPGTAAVLFRPAWGGRARNGAPHVPAAACARAPTGPGDDSPAADQARCGG